MLSLTHIERNPLCFQVLQLHRIQEELLTAILFGIPCYVSKGFRAIKKSLLNG
jgi:hypothetical protein